MNIIKIMKITTINNAISNFAKLALVVFLLLSCSKEDLLPNLTVDTHELTFSTQDTSKSLLLNNTGNESLSWSITTSEEWIRPTIKSGFIEGNSFTTIDVNIDISDLYYGDYTAILFINSNGGSIGISINVNVDTSNNRMVYWHNNAIYTMNYDGTNQSILAPRNENYGHFRISADGQKVVYDVEIFQEGTSTLSERPIMSINIDGEAEKQLTNGTINYSPSWSFDGEEILFSRYNETSNSSDIYKMSVDGSNVMQLTDFGENSFCYTPVFSPDGNKIAFALQLFPDDDYEIALMNIDGSNLTIVTNNDVNDYYPDFSADGSKIVFTTGNSFLNLDIHIMNSDGTKIETLLGDNNSNSYARFGKSNNILFTSRRNGIQGIYKMDKYGENLEVVKDNSCALADWAKY